MPEEETPAITLCKAYFNRLKRNNHRLNRPLHGRRDGYYKPKNANVFPIPVTRTYRYINSLVTRVCATGNMCI